MHLHFDSDEEEGRHRMDASAAAAPSCPPAAPSPAASGLRLPRCLCSVRVDFNDLSDPCYVFKVVRSADASVFAASVSNNRIKLYGMQASNLTHIGDLTGHGGTITDVAFPLVDAPHALFSASRDGTVRGWDTRAGRQAEAFSAGNQELFSFAVAEHVLAAGGQGNILFYDRRAGGKQLACFDDTHMDDVTQLRFHAASRQLISGSQDGLLAVHSLAGGINDEEGFAAALNVGTSVEVRLGCIFWALRVLHCICFCIQAVHIIVQAQYVCHCQASITWRCSELFRGAHCQDVYHFFSCS